MQTHHLRRQFLEYFKKQQHAVIASSPVVPHDDPTLLFINAGMNQFKDVFLGKTVRDYVRATTSQKCIRVGGKHNDLENVGHTSRHLTFFEMLGNFSFGAYFKKEAITFAWEVATQILGFEPERIWPTVFREDDEAFELWTHYVPRERITRMDEKDNFWAMGDTGPCGPCSELYYDRGAAYGNGTNPANDPEGNRFLEFWNLVFMQYNRTPEGKLEPLPKPSIDTGAGLERIMALKLGVESVFETDVLRGLIAQVEEISKVSYRPDDDKASAFRVIADHLRCLAFAIADGVQPSNVDRGYVLRKVLRRAVRYGRQLGLEEPFLGKVFPRLLKEMGGDYRELEIAKERIVEILTVEEEAFLRTLRRGGNILNQVIEKAQKDSNKKISGDDAFKLKDTYGLPIDEILLLAKDSGLIVDLERYQELELQAKERSRNTQKITQQLAGENLFETFVQKNGATTFLGYSQENTESAVQAIVVDGQFVDSISAGQEGMIVLDKTPFYAEMGGQVGDSGKLKGNEGLFDVATTESPYKGVSTHSGKMSNGTLKIGQKVNAVIDKQRRKKIANNHTATHLLHWALHEVLGEHIKQAGSVVDAERLRFDFSHHKGLTEQEIEQIEALVNHRIRENLPVKTYEISYDEAQKQTEIKQFFGEKYGAKVRVIDIDFSKELCGGTHITQLGSIGLFRIAKESSIAAGIRRIEAVTGAEAIDFCRQSEKLLTELAEALKTQVSKLPTRIEKLAEENRLLQLQLRTVQKENTGRLVHDLLNKVETIDGISFLGAHIPLSTEELRGCADELSAKLPSSVLVLAIASARDNCQLLIRVSDDLVNKGIKAGEMIKEIAPLVGGSGGGKGNSAQAGGKNPEGIAAALEQAKEFIRKKGV